MGWPGPRRRTVPLKLSDEEERPVRELAATLPYVAGKPNVSAAIRQILAEWDAGKGRTDLRATTDTPEETP